MRSICVFTGSRAEYGILRPVMQKIQESDNLSLQLAVGGSHLMPEHGSTVKEIEKDGFDIDVKIECGYQEDSQKEVVDTMGQTLLDFNQKLSELEPDITVVLGDRFEILPIAIASAYNGTPVAHISGGDKSSGYDEYTRHAVTKISHLHFPTNPESEERILRMGEKKERVYEVGSSSLDTIYDKDLMVREELEEKYDLGGRENLFLLIQHPVSTNPDSAGEEMQKTLEAVDRFDAEVVGIYPNSDPGSSQIMEKIQRFEGDRSEFTWFKNLPFEDYLSIMKNADVMIGNSSSGIVESTAFNLPVVNIGPRQKNRTRGENVIDVEHNIKSISEGIDKALNDKSFLRKIKEAESPYGEGNAADRITEVLGEVELDQNLREKQIDY